MSSEVLFSEEQIQQKVKELSVRIRSDLRDHFIALAVLNGAYMFMADLSKELWRQGCRDFQVDFIGISSYGIGTHSSESPVLTKDTTAYIENNHILLIEDIMETGFTLKYLHDLLLSRKPASLKTAVLLLKKNKSQVDFVPDYVGFEVDADVWVEGYGLDSGGLGRGSPYIVKKT